MKKQTLLFLMILFIAGTACRDDDDGNGPGSLSGYERIVNKNWRLVDQEIRSNGVIIADGRDLFDCELDDVMRFDGSGEGSTRYGLLKCDPAQPDEEFYFWSLITNDTKLILDYGGPSLRVFNIILNDGRELGLERFTIEDIDNDGTPESIQSITFYSRN